MEWQAARAANQKEFRALYNQRRLIERLGFEPPVQARRRLATGRLSMVGLICPRNQGRYTHSLGGRPMNQHRSYLLRAAILGSIWWFVSIPTLSGIDQLLLGSFYPVPLVVWFYWFGVFALGHYLLIGVPLLALFLWRGWLSRKAFAVKGFTVAAIGWINFAWLIRVLEGHEKLGDFFPLVFRDPLFLFSLLAFGLLSGVVLWGVMEQVDSQFHVAKAVLVGLFLSFAMISPLRLMYMWGMHRETYPINDLLGYYVWNGFLSTMVFLIFGVPLLSLLLWRGWLSRKAFAVGGSATAVVAGIVWIFAVGITAGEGYLERYPLNDFLWMVDLLFFGICGFLTGLVLWRVMRKRICTALVSSQTASQTVQ